MSDNEEKSLVRLPLLSTLPEITGCGPPAPSVSDLPLPQVVEEWAALDYIESMVKKRKEELRARLLAEAAAAGEANEKGSKKLLIGGHTVTSERRQGEAPDEEKVRELLARKQLPEKEVFVSVSVTKLDVSRLYRLAETGHISEEELASTKKPANFALKVKLSSDFEALLKP